MAIKDEIHQISHYQAVFQICQEENKSTRVLSSQLILLKKARNWKILFSSSSLSYSKLLLHTYKHTDRNVLSKY